MDVNPYEAPQHSTVPAARATQDRASLIASLGAFPFGVLGLFCFWTAWTYVDTSAAADHPYIPGYLSGGATSLTVAAAVYVVARIAAQSRR